MRIPKSFRLFATTINVVWDNKRLNDNKVYGLSEYSKAQIVLSTTDGTEKLSKDTIVDTFYHEKVHMILDSMHERDLSSNEKFVDVFAKLLRQSDETKEFDGEPALFEEIGDSYHLIKSCSNCKDCKKCSEKGECISLK